MLTKKQTLWAMPILITSFAALCLMGYVFEVWLAIKNSGLIALLGIALIANMFAVIYIFFSIFLSFGTALIFNAASPYAWEKTGNPFYYLLWRELQEATNRKSDERTD